jgi:hypothetical protein
MSDSQKGLDLVDEMAAISAADAEAVTRVKDALPGMIATVEAGGEQQHIHTGLLNATVRKIDGKVLVRVNISTPAGRPRMKEVHLA